MVICIIQLYKYHKTPKISYLINVGTITKEATGMNVVSCLLNHPVYNILPMLFGIENILF